jgi:hypothetical protein
MMEFALLQKITSLRSDIFKYMTLDEMGYSPDRSRAPELSEIFNNALSNDKVPSELKKRIVFCLGDIEEFQEQSKRSIYKRY